MRMGACIIGVDNVAKKKNICLISLGRYLPRFTVFIYNGYEKNK